MNTLVKSSTISLRGYISLLLKVLIIIGLLSSVSFAEDGLVLPETSNISFTWTTDADTVRMVITNSSSLSLDGIVISAHASTRPNMVECRIDDVISFPMANNEALGTVYDDLYTTSWEIGSSSDSVEFKFYPVTDNFTFYGLQTEALFGLSKNTGAPTSIIWHR